MEYEIIELAMVPLKMDWCIWESKMNPESHQL
jgi:hypothetical protein